MHPTGSAVMADDLSAQALDQLEKEAEARLEAAETAMLREYEIAGQEPDPSETTAIPYRSFANLYEPDE
jgi:hypothetical protein